MYYDYHDLLTHNALFNFIVGNRGSGKTFGFKKWAISSFLKTGKQFIYLRRYKSEIDDMSGFFGDVSEHFPECEFEVKGKKLYINKKLAGYLVSLSNALVKKSVNYNEVDKIGFDEFVIDKGNLRYLQNEVVKFLEFYETVARMRDDVRAVFMSNAVSIVNPYFLYWDLKPNPNKRFTKKGHMLIEFVRNDEFVEAKYKTRFGQIIKGTEYGDYAIENKFLLDNDTFVEKKTPEAKFICSVSYNGTNYGFWVDYKEGKFFVSYKLDPSNKHSYSLTDADHNPNKMLLRNKKHAFYLVRFIEAYEGGYCYFENMQIKNQAMEMFRLLKA